MLEPLDRHHHGTGDQTRGEPAEESGVDGQRDGAADEAGHQPGPVGHAVRDVAGQDRDEEARRRAPPIWKSSAAQLAASVQHEVLGDGRRLVDLVAADGEAEGDQQPARGDERDHVTHAGHQPLAQPGAVAARSASPARSPCGARPPAACGDLAALGLCAHLGDEFGGPVDAGLHADVDGGLPGEPVLAPVRATSCAKITPSAAAMTAGSSRVNPAEPWVSTTTSTPSASPAAFCRRLGGHVGVGDAGGAGGDGDDPEGRRRPERRPALGGPCRAAAACRWPVPVCRVGRPRHSSPADQGGAGSRRVRSPSRSAAVNSVSIEAAGQAGQDRQVGVVRTGRRGYQEDQVGGTVGRAEVDARRRCVRRPASAR